MEANTPSSAAEGGRQSIPLPRLMWWVVAMVVLVALVAGFRIGWPIYREQSAIREFERWGGRIVTIKGGPFWLRRMIGDKHMSWLDRLAAVDFANKPTTDAALTHLGGLTCLHTLGLSNSLVTDGGLSHLQGLANLQFLYLGGTQVTDAGLTHLQGLASLRYLLLSGTQVSDAGLSHLRGLSSLLYLNLSGTQVTDEGVTELQRALPNLVIER